MTNNLHALDTFNYFSSIKSDQPEEIIDTLFNICLENDTESMIFNEALRMISKLKTNKITPKPIQVEEDDGIVECYLDSLNKFLDGVEDNDVKEYIRYVNN